MHETRRSSNTVFGVLVLGGLAALGIIGLKDSFVDGRGNRNIVIGPFHRGECADALSNPDTHTPATDSQLLSSIQAIGRACGYCAGPELSSGNISYSICVDPESISLHASGVTGETNVVGYMATEPAGAPEGIIFSALNSNPGVCTTTITELETNMNDYFGRAYDAKTASGLVPTVQIAVGSGDACTAATT